MFSLADAYVAAFCVLYVKGRGMIQPKVFSFIAPWAQLIAGVPGDPGPMDAIAMTRDVEYRGPLLIHAAHEVVDCGDQWYKHTGLSRSEVADAEALLCKSQYDYDGNTGMFRGYSFDKLRSGLIGVVQLEDMVKISDLADPSPWLPQDPGVCRHVWKLGDRVPFSPPYSLHEKRGLFDLPRRVIENMPDRIREAIDETT